MSNKRVIEHLPGEKQDELLEMYKQAAGCDPFGTFMILPSSRMVKTLTRALNDEGFPVITSSIVTLDKLVRNNFDDFATNEILLDQEESELLFDNILTDMEGKLSTLCSRGSHSFSLAQILRRFHSTITRYKVNYPEDLGSHKSNKSSDIGMVFNAYNSHLIENEMIDGDLLLIWFMDAIRQKKIDVRNMFVYGLYEYEPLEKDIMKSLVEMAKNVVYFNPCFNNPNFFQDDLGWLPNMTTEAPAASHWLDSLFTETRGEVPGVPMEVLEAKESKDEFKSIAQEIRNLIADGSEPGSIAVVLTEPSREMAHVHSVFEDFAIPFDAAAGTSLAESPLIDGIISLLEVPTSNYGRMELVNALKSPYLNFQIGTESGYKPDMYSIDLLSREAKIVEGKEGWLRGMGWLSRYYDERAGNPDLSEHGRKAYSIKAARLEKMIVYLQGLFNTLDELIGEKTTLEHITSVRTLLELLELNKQLEFDDTAIMEADARALSKLYGILESMERTHLLLPGGTLLFEDFIEGIKRILRNKNYNTNRRNRTAVQVVGLRELAHTSFSYVFLTSLNEGLLPRVNLSELLATEQESNRMKLLSKRDLLRQESYYFACAIASASQNIYLSRPKVRGENPLISSYFLEALKLNYTTHPWEHEEYPGSWEEHQKAEGTAMTQGHFKDIKVLNKEGSIPSNVARIMNIERCHRWMDYDSDYDGILTNTDAQQEIAGIFDDEYIYSAGSLENYAKCPFSFFLRRIMHIDGIEEVETELTPMERGNAMHNILFKFFSQRHLQGLGRINKDQKQEALEALQKIAEDELGAFHFNGPSWNAYWNSLLGTTNRPGLLEAILNYEVNIHPDTLEPLMFELSFGLPVRPGECDTSSRTDTVDIDIPWEEEPSAIKLRGRIDRVDITSDNRAVVMDYKTGKVPTGPAICNGLVLQAPLYIEAIRNIFPDLDPISGAYYQVKSTNELGIKSKLGFKGDDNILNGIKSDSFPYTREEFQVLMNSLLEKIGRHIQDMRLGIFNPTREMECDQYRYCNYKHACRLDGLRNLIVASEDREASENGEGHQEKVVTEPATVLTEVVD